MCHKSNEFPQFLHHHCAINAWNLLTFIDFYDDEILVRLNISNAIQRCINDVGFVPKSHNENHDNDKYCCVLFSLKCIYVLHKSLPVAYNKNKLHGGTLIMFVSLFPLQTTIVRLINKERKYTRVWNSFRFSPFSFIAILTFITNLLLINFSKVLFTDFVELFSPTRINKKRLQFNRQILIEVFFILFNFYSKDLKRRKRKSMKFIFFLHHRRRLSKFIPNLFILFIYFLPSNEMLSTQQRENKWGVTLLLCLYFFALQFSIFFGFFPDFFPLSLSLCLFFISFPFALH